MGEYADAMIEGDCCQWCGCFFKKSYGYPVICKDCAKGKSKKELKKLGVQVANE